MTNKRNERARYKTEDDELMVWGRATALGIVAAAAAGAAFLFVVTDAHA